MKFKQQFEPLDTQQHLVKDFDCTKKSMNDFLIKFAAKHAKQGISTTMVLTGDDNNLSKLPIAAYYTLGISTVYKQEIPSSSLPNYPIPVTLLARLAVDIHYQKQNLGTKTLIYALRHAVKLNDQGLKTHGLILDVLDDEALRFYKQFNFFQEFPGNAMKLFVSMQTLQKI